MWPISCDNFAPIFTTPRNFRLWKTSSFAHQFGGAAFRNHHVARRFFINNIWRNDYFEECRLKMLMVYLCTFNGNWCKFFIDLYLHFHWICVHLKISLVKFEKGIFYILSREMKPVHSIDCWFCVCILTWHIYWPRSSIRTFRITRVHVLKSLWVTDRRSLFVMTCSWIAKIAFASAFIHATCTIPTFQQNTNILISGKIFGFPPAWHYFGKLSNKLLPGAILNASFKLYLIKKWKRRNQ